MNARKIISLVLEAAIVASMITGVVLTSGLSGGFMGGATTFLYFTIQSNLWMGAIAFVMACFTLAELLGRKKGAPRAVLMMKYVFTVSITLTGVVFCGVLAPTMPGAFGSAANVLTHVVVPLLSVVDLFVADAPQGLKYKEMFYTWIPPLYYLGFATVGYFLDWNFGMGNNYPYFFLNWDSPAGAFGFTDDPVYFMGSFYWIIVLLIFVSLVAMLYLALLRRRAKR